MQNEQRDLIRRAKNGEVDAFEKLIADYQVYAYNIAFRMMNNEEDAKDVAQEAFIKVFKKIKGFAMTSDFSTWLYRIVINSCYDAIRKQNKTKVVSMDAPVETKEGLMHIDLKDTSISVEQAYEGKSLRALVAKALMSLPPDNRICVVLRDIQGYAYDEIAALLKIPLGTVKSRIKRGRVMLRQTVEADKAFSKEMLM